MVTSEVVAYIKQAKNRGKSLEAIRTELRAGKWTDADITQAVAQATNVTSPDEAAAPSWHDVGPRITDAPKNNAAIKKHSILKRFAIIVFVLFMLGGAAFGVLRMFPQTGIYILSRSPSRLNKKIAGIPKPVIHEIRAPVKPGQYPRVTTDSFSFSTPWKFASQASPADSVTVFEFDGARKIIFDKKISSFNYLDIMSESDPGARAKIQAVFGEEITGSQYAFFSEMMNSSINDITLSSPARTATAKYILLTFKSTFILGDDPKIYSFAVNDIRGFESKSPDNNFYQVQIFDNSDKRYELAIFSQDVTQDDIDYILSTFTPA